MGSSSGLEVNTESQHKRFCLRHQQEGEDAVDLDRISNLPDHIISHILSLLEIKCAMKTSILSSRWRYLWTTIDVLRISDASFEEGDGGFPDFVEHILFRSTSKNIQVFDLHCDSFTDLAHINTWICYVLATKNVSRVFLHVESDCEYFPIPPSPKCILTCNMLVSLSCSSHVDIKIPSSVASFPCLKIIILIGLYPDDGEVLQKLLSMCPVLEALCIEGFLYAHESVTLFISVPSLKKLILDLKVDHFGIYDHNVIINTPTLEELSIVDHMFARYTINILDSLFEVFLDVGEWHVDDVEPEHVSRLAELIQAIGGTKSLYLSATTIAVLTRSKALSLGWTDEWPTFKNLEKLVMRSYELCGWMLLPGILKSSPYLECLELLKDLTEYKVDEEFNWVPPQRVPDCLLENLVIVSFEDFKGRKNELDVVEYLLQHAQALDFMIVGVLPRILSNELVEKLVTLPRCSNSCKVEVYKGRDFGS